MAETAMAYAPQKKEFALHPELVPVGDYNGAAKELAEVLRNGGLRVELGYVFEPKVKNSLYDGVSWRFGRATLPSGYDTMIRTHELPKEEVLDLETRKLKDVDVSKLRLHEVVIQKDAVVSFATFGSMMNLLLQTRSHTYNFEIRKPSDDVPHNVEVAYAELYARRGSFPLEKSISVQYSMHSRPKTAEMNRKLAFSLWMPHDAIAKTSDFETLDELSLLV